jgi:hypothetical protein
VKIVKYSAALFLLLLLGIGSISCSSHNDDDIFANVNVINYKDFFLSAESLGLTSSIRGTIFIKGDVNQPNQRHAQISAWIELDPQDWGGVGFYLKEGSGWEVTSVTTDYPQGYPVPETETFVFTSDWNRSVAIGRQWPWRERKNHPGGKGSFIMELDPDHTKKDLPEDFTIGISIGSKYDYIVGPVNETVQVPLNINYREEITPTPTSPQSKFTDNWNSGMMTDEEKEKWGIEEIPGEQLQERAGELGICPETVDDFLKSSEPFFYIAHNAYPKVIK